MDKLTTKPKRGEPKQDKKVYTGTEKIEKEKFHQNLLSMSGNSDPYYFMEVCRRNVNIQFNNNRYSKPGYLFCIMLKKNFSNVFMLLNKLNYQI